jgi:hypothetical protein
MNADESIVHPIILSRIILNRTHMQNVPRTAIKTKGFDIPVSAKGRGESNRSCEAIKNEITAKMKKHRKKRENLIFP